MLSLLILGLAMIMAYAADAEAGWFTVPEPEQIPEPEPEQIPEPEPEPVIGTTDWLVLAIHPDNICAARYLGSNYICLCATRRELYAFRWNNIGPASPTDFFERHMPDVNRGYNPIEQETCDQLEEYY